MFLQIATGKFYDGALANLEVFKPCGHNEICRLVFHSRDLIGSINTV